MKLIFSALLSVECICFFYIYQYRKIVNSFAEKSNKYEYYFMILNDWVKNKYENKNMCGYLLDKNIKRAAVYGMGNMGKRMCDELLENGIEVGYAIDRRGGSSYKGIKIRKLTESLDAVDIVIITVFAQQDEIEKDIRKAVDCPVISMEKLLYDNKAGEVG